jgi:hypothetical protein
MLPNDDFVLQTQDVIQVSATADGATLLRKRLGDYGKD